MVIDARADTLIKTIPLGQALCRLCHNATNSRTYISDETGNVVYVIRDTSTGISEGTAGREARADVFEARPNPFRGSTIVRCLQGANADAPLCIYAQTGALVRTLAGDGSWHWDGRDDRGRPAPAGVYVVRSPGKAGASLLVAKNGVVLLTCARSGLLWH